MALRLGLVVAALVVPPAIARVTVPAWEDAAFSMGRGLSGALDAASPAIPPLGRIDVGEEVVGLPVPVSMGGARHAATPKRAPARRSAQAKGKKAAHVAPKGILVRAATVLALANAGARPRGSPVGPEGERPAGLALSGVSALGVGVRDGDIVTEVSGMPATDEGVVVAAVLHARAHHRPAVSGRFWRQHEEWNLVVEMPYPDDATPQKTARR